MQKSVGLLSPKLMETIPKAASVENYFARPSVPRSSGMRVLVLDGHSSAAVETLQSLGRQGLEVDVATESHDCLAFHSRYASRKFCQPPQNLADEFHSLLHEAVSGVRQTPQNRTEGFHVWLRERFAERRYDLIVPTTETSLLGFRSLDPSDPIRHRAVLPKDMAIDIALDKQRTCELAEALAVRVPSSKLIHKLEDAIEPVTFPVALKSAHSKVVVDGELCTIPAQMAKNASEYMQVLKRWLPYTPMVRQDYIHGRGVGAEFLFNHGRKIWHFVHERVHELPLTGGASTYRRSIRPDPNLLADAEKMLTALQWHGVAMVEFKVDGNGRHWLIEINPRMWGSLSLAIDSGVDFPIGLWLLARGLEVPPQPRYRTGYYSRDIQLDFEWFKENLCANHDDHFLLTKSRFFSILEFLRPLIGRESWDHFDRHDLAVTGGIVRSVLEDKLEPAYAKLRKRIVKVLSPA